MYTINIDGCILAVISIGEGTKANLPKSVESHLNIAYKKTTPASIKTADYISEHLGELTQLARKENLTMLTYLLEMAQLEAMELSESIRLRK